MTNDRATWRSGALGEAKEVQLPGGTLRYHDVGSGPPIVFAHGLLVNANLWRKVVDRLSRDFRCITLDLPLGSSALPMPDADLSPIGAADLIIDAIEAIGVEGATLVGNDTGGALSQIAVTRRPGTVGGLVLTSCDAFDNFPPRIFQLALAPAQIPALSRILFAPLRLRPLRRLPFAFGWLAKRAMDPQAEDSYVLPPLTNPANGDDAARLIRGVETRYTQDAAERLLELDIPALIAWSSEDKLFPAEHAERLAELIPEARLEWVEDSYTYSPEDNPERLSELIAGFVREPREAATAPGAGRG